MKRLFVGPALASLLSLPAATQAEVRLPNILSSHAVLQRDKPIRVWGWADPGESVEVKLHNQRVSTTTDALGHWDVALAPEAAGGPYELDVNGSSAIKLEDILIGDVYLASGQSNMGYPLQGIGASVMPGSKEVIASANDPNLRLIHIPRDSATYPQQDQAAQWTRSTPEAATTFSALGYLFGLDISKREHVPVGVIDSTFGGTSAAAWTSLDTLSASPQLLPEFAYWSSLADNQGETAQSKRRPPSADPTILRTSAPDAYRLRYPILDAWRPAGLYNSMIAPLVNYAIKGVVWYQGETDTPPTLAGLYSEMFPAMIADWRAKWREGNFPFIFVQISSFDARGQAQWGTIRDAQRRALALANTAMVVTLDVGDPNNIHPANKRAVADRMVLAARGLVYGESVEYAGPLFREAAPEGAAMRVWFDHANGLQAKGKIVQGFEVAGPDAKFVAAEAEADGNSVLVKSPQVAAPRFVRYAWANATDANLCNASGLPASTFTTAPH